MTIHTHTIERMRHTQLFQLGNILPQKHSLTHTQYCIIDERKISPRSERRKAAKTFLYFYYMVMMYYVH